MTFTPRRAARRSTAPATGTGDPLRGGRAIVVRSPHGARLAAGTGDSLRGGRRAQGWTLIELTIVISLITILSTIALVGYGNAVTRSREAVLKEDLFRMRDAIDQYHADLGAYPPDLYALVSAGYLRAVPEDPMTRSSETWVVVPAEPDPSDPFVEGVYDVRSGSGGTALDGTAHADW